MFNISDSTIITGFSGKRAALGQALADRNLHRALHYDYFGARTQRGTVQVLLNGEWRTVRFAAGRGWARTLDVQ